MDIIPIAILASDPITWEGSVPLLSAHPDLLILPPELRPHARILLVITPTVSGTVLRDMEDAQAAACSGGGADDESAQRQPDRVARDVRPANPSTPTRVFVGGQLR